MSHPIYRVKAFEIVAPFTLCVRFTDGVERRIDFRPVLAGELFGPLRDVAVFDQVRIDPEIHTLVWPNGADFDPATLHDWPQQGTPSHHRRMDLDTAKIDDAVLALLYLTLHEQVRAWKSMDWAALGRLHENGLILDPVNSSKSVVLTAAGLRLAERLFTAQFARLRNPPTSVRYGSAPAAARAAEGVTGSLCRSAVDGAFFFRVYSDDHSFIDYALRHDDLRVTIASDAMASFYDIGDERVLDHSPEVLGLPPSPGNRAGRA